MLARGQAHKALGYASGGHGQECISGEFGQFCVVGDRCSGADWLDAEQESLGRELPSAKRSTSCGQLNNNSVDLPRFRGR
jgi:hypothetical protein